MLNTAVLWLALASPSAATLPSLSPDVLDAVHDRLGEVNALATVAEESGAIPEGEAKLLYAQLDRAESLLSQGDWLASLRPLTRAELALSRPAHGRELSATVQSLEALNAEVADFREQLGQLNSPLTRKAERPASLQALLEDAHARARTYASAAPEQGREARVSAGIYYLSLGQSFADRARWLDKLTCAAPARPVDSVPGLARYLASLEAEILKIYQPPLSQGLHKSFIQISASLKFARELEAQAFELGALEEGLAAARGLAQLNTTGAAPKTPVNEQLLVLLERHKKRVHGTQGDMSLAEALLSEARSLLDRPDADQMEATAILQRVLPDYFRAFEAPGNTHAKDAKVEVVITLVRWPFT